MDVEELVEKLLPHCKCATLEESRAHAENVAAEVLRARTAAGRARILNERLGVADLLKDLELRR